MIERSKPGRIGARILQQYNDSGYYSVPQAADVMVCCSKTVRNLIKAGVLTYARVGRRVVVPRAAVDAYMKAQMRIGSVA